MAERHSMKIESWLEESPERIGTLLRKLERVSVVEVIVDGEPRFFGSPAELAARSIAQDGLAGEHPLERSLRSLFGASPVNSAARPGSTATTLPRNTGYESEEH